MTREFISAKYDADTLTVDFVGNDGTHLLRSGETVAWRFDNPGNLRPAGDKLMFGAIGIGQTKGNKSFVIFKSYDINGDFLNIATAALNTNESTR